MSNKEYLIYEKKDLVAVADAVRAKTGSSETYLVSELPAAINNIVGGGSEEMELLLSSHLENKSNPHEVTAEQAGAVPKERTINGKALTANITLSASDVGADVNGAASAVQGGLDAHTTNKSNPHEVSLTQLGVNATAAELNYVDGVTSNIQAQLNKKMGDYSIELYNGTSGNPKPVRFASFNYSTCVSEEGIAAKIGMVSGHGNGSSYAFMQDVVIKVNYQGGVEVDNMKYYGTSAGTYDGAARQYGDIFWLKDETNKIIDFYCLMGQYARVNSTPWKRLTYSSKGTVTQYTSCTVYSSGTMNWANNDEFAMKSEIGAVDARLAALESSAIAILSGAAEPTSAMGDDGDIYLVTG